MSGGVFEEQEGTEAPASGIWDTTAPGASQSGATIPPSLLTRTAGDDGSIQWQVARPRRRWRGVMVATVAAAILVVGYFAIPGDEPAITTTSRAARPPSASTRPAATSRVVAPAQPIDTAPSAGAGSAPAVEEAITPAPSGTGPYAVQIAAVPTDREAEQLLGWLAKEGYSAYLEPTTTERGRLLRVRVGPLPSLEVAQGVAAQLGEAGYAERWITGGEAGRTELR